MCLRDFFVILLATKIGSSRMNKDENRVKRKIFQILFPILSLVLSSWFLIENTEPHSCTIFTAVQGETVLYGDNFDYHEGELVIGFFPSSAEGYGSVHFGFTNGEGQSFSRVVNDHGLAWAVNSIPKAKLNPHTEKRYSHAKDNYVYTISKRAATVEEAIQLAKEFNFGESFEVQIHIADASGDAVVLGPGRDGEIAFTRKPTGDGYLLSTNFNRAIPENGPVDFRWEVGNSMLEKLGESQTLTPKYAAEILEAVHLRTLTTHTLYSNVSDLKNGDIYIHYMSQYNETMKLNIAEELAKGQRVVEARSLFSTETAGAGDASYYRFETRFFSAIAGVILTGIILISGLVLIITRRVRRHKVFEIINNNHKGG